jgi:DNA-binding transcriptional MerR regulator
MLKTDRKIEKLYYSISEVAELFDVNQSLIRFWEKEFDILTPKKNKKGNRMFTPKDIENLKLIYHLVRERGYTLQGARDKLRDNRDDVLNKVEILATLQRLRGFLMEMKQNI